MRLRRVRHGAILLLLLIAGIAAAPNASADDTIKGVITGLGNDGTLTMRTDEATKMILVMNEASRVRQVDRVRQLRQGARTLIPGLRVHVTGIRQGANRFVVDRITFDRSDMKTALAIRGGEQQIVATTGELASTNARIANLDNYTAVSTVTVYFRNGRSGIERQYQAQLQQLAVQATAVPSYVIQIQGYASDVGSQALNQRLSAQRANAVTAALQQSGVPLTNVIVPAAMGVSEQVATNKTAKGQAENRRTVVTLLQNKGISGR